MGTSSLGWRDVRGAPDVDEAVEASQSAVAVKECIVGWNWSAVWSVALGVSLTALVCGGIALYSAGVVIDENNLVSGPVPALWAMVVIGVVGLLVSLPCWFAAEPTKVACG